MVGVYKLVNKNNGKVYVGQSANLCTRKHVHWNHLKNNIHSNRLIQEDYNNGDEFDFVILEEVTDISKLHDVEEKWADLLDAYNLEHGYNISRGLRGFNVMGSNKGHNPYKPLKIRRKNDGVIFSSINEAAAAVGISACNLSNHIHGRRPFRVCRVWFFEKVEE